MEKQTKILLLSLSLLSGIMLWLSFPPYSMYFLGFIGLVPLLWVIHHIQKRHTERQTLSIVFYTYVCMLTWNFLTTYWIYKATLPGAIAAIVLNSMLMLMPFILYSKYRYFVRKDNALAILVFFWITFEFLHFNWDLSWPWLSLGHVFSSKPEIVQWYEYTGVLGGTLWIWISNILLFNLLLILTTKNKIRLNVLLKNALLTVIILFAPVVISYLIKFEAAKTEKYNVVIVQPNIDPYLEKFADNTFGNQLQKLIALSESQLDDKSILLVWPETALSMSFDENSINNDGYIHIIRKMLENYPRLKLISGLDSYRFFQEDEKVTATARYFEPWDKYYDSYNAAILLDQSDHYEIYHKSRLVPGVEKMPYPEVLGFLSKLTIDLGGTSGSLGKQEEASVFRVNDRLIVAPIICYESIYGDYIGDFVKRGANLIAVITNDGWWGNTDGYKQHFYYARLIAVSHRKDIVRSANTGISAYINARGEVVQQLPWWTEGVIKMNISINDRPTFYSLFGDYIGRISTMLSILVLLIILAAWLKRKSLLLK